MLSHSESRFIESCWLGRLATVSVAGLPDVATVTCPRWDGESLIISGRDLPGTTKFLNLTGSGPCCVIIDELHSVNPFVPRGIKLVGRGESGESEGVPVIRVYPATVITWGLDDDGAGGPVTLLRRNVGTP